LRRPFNLVFVIAFMNKEKIKKITNEFGLLTQKILQLTNNEIPRIEFMRGIASLLLDFSGCDAIELWMKESRHSNRCEVTRSTIKKITYEFVSFEDFNEDQRINKSLFLILKQLRFQMLLGTVSSNTLFFSTKGSFGMSNAKEQLAEFSKHLFPEQAQDIVFNVDFLSVAIIPLIVGEENVGLLQLESQSPNFFCNQEIELYERLCSTLGIALMNQCSQAALRERVKELTCLYSLAQLAEKSRMSLENLLKGIVEILPSAWQYPERTFAKITLDDHVYASSNFPESRQKQTANIIVRNEVRGVVEVVADSEKPILCEERNLIEAIAREISYIIERREAEEEKIRLQDQLRHADRLATIGQLVAGVAHELNEPLGNILGFAQLIKKSYLNSQVEQDINKIIDASLYAREVIRKLMLFARQTPPSNSLMNLNEIIEESLYFLEARCIKSGIELIRILDPQLPKIVADRAQMNQVLVNLIVNAIQAMPNGGKLYVKTQYHDGYISLIVHDTGIGMSEKIIKQIFIPFFTTKDVDQGTGLGLAVVHGIITSHKGSIKVTSKEGDGSMFEITFPVSVSYLTEGVNT